MLLVGIRERKYTRDNLVNNINNTFAENLIFWADFGGRVFFPCRPANKPKIDKIKT